MTYSGSQPFIDDDFQLDLSDTLQGEVEAPVEEGMAEEQAPMGEAAPQTIDISIPTDVAQPTEEEDKYAEYRNNPEIEFRDGKPYYIKEAPKPGLFSNLSYFGTPLDEQTKQVSERLSAPGSGLINFGIDLVNKIPGVNVPRIEFEDQAANAVKDVSEVILPTILMTGAGNSIGSATHSRVNWRLGNEKFIQWFSKTGIAAGSGALVDEIALPQERDDNAQRAIRDFLETPESENLFGIFPPDWATQDGDSTEVKRSKNRNEGIGFGTFSDMAIGLGSFLRNRGAFRAAAKGPLPRNETAKEFFAETRMPPSDTPGDSMLSSAMNREYDLDNLGAYNFSQSVDLDTPQLGVHDLFDYTEQGLRSVDNYDVASAAVDVVRIERNIDGTHGRLGSIVSDSALKYGLQADQLPRRGLVSEIKDRLRRAGKYDFDTPRGMLKFEEVDAAGQRLAARLVDPAMSVDKMKSMLRGYENIMDGVRNLDDVGYSGTFRAIKGLMDDYYNMDSLKASAYLQTSMAGQVADMAEGARLMEGTPAVMRAQEQILDRLEFLMGEKAVASYVRGRGLNFLNMWKRLTAFGDQAKLAELGLKEDVAFKEGLQRAYKSGKETRQTIEAISKQRPQMLEPLILAYELTDGNVNSMRALNEYMLNSTGTLSKAFADGKPDIPSEIVRGAYSTFFNSLLTSASTPLKAAWSNSVLLVEKPLTILAGSMTLTDKASFRRGLYALGAWQDTMSKGMKHMGFVFKKASLDPTSVEYIMRGDLAVKNQQRLDLLRKFAEAGEAEGNSGALAFYHQLQALHDLGDSPVLRFGANAMTAFDGFSRSVVGNWEARMRAFDEITDGGKKPFTQQGADQLAELHYKKMFDKNGMITDSAVEYQSREIAMNLDSPAIDAVNALITRVPLLKPFMLFPRTSANMLSMVNKHSPVGIFAADYNKMAYRPRDSFSADEIRQILEERGIKVDRYAEVKFDQIRAEVRGRKAIGTLAVMAGVPLAMHGYLHGSGHYNQAKQRVRNLSKWRRDSIKVGNRWMPLELLGPSGEIMKLTADIMDNSFLLGEAATENLLNKTAFVIGANLTNKSFMQGLEPLFSMSGGNEADIQRWMANNVNAAFPLGGVRKEWGRILTPELRQVNMEMMQLLRNNNNIADFIDPEGALPLAKDFLYGGNVGVPDSLLARIFNAATPFKSFPDMKPEQKFLVDIGYDARPTFSKSEGGVEYTPEQQSELLGLMGEQGFLLRDVRRIMKIADEIGYIENLQGTSADDIDAQNFGGIMDKLDLALREAKRRAEGSSSFKDDIREQEALLGYKEGLEQRGDLDKLLKFNTSNP